MHDGPGPYRAGPWPGLTLRGAAVLVGCAVLLGIALTLTGAPRQPLPDLLLLGVMALLPMLIATRIVNTPGAAAAVSGAYLLPRSLLSLADPTLELPPLLLAPAIVFDVVWWLRELPSRQRQRRRAPRPQLTRRRAALAGALFGMVLCAVEPSFQMLQGQDAASWALNSVLLAAAMTGLACGAISVLSVRGKAS